MAGHVISLNLTHKVNIIGFYQTQLARVRRAAVPNPDACKRAAALLKLSLIKTSVLGFFPRETRMKKSR